MSGLKIENLKSNGGKDASSSILVLLHENFSYGKNNVIEGFQTKDIYEIRCIVDCVTYETWLFQSFYEG